MPWQALTHFSIPGTNIPFEWLVELRFVNTFYTINKYLDEEDKLKEDADRVRNQIRSHRFTPEYKHAWLELIRQLAKRKEITEHMSVVLKDETTDPALRQEVLSWNERFVAHQKQLASIRDLFEQELKDKRKILWKFASEPRFQEAIFQLSPDFLERIQQYLPSWEHRPRDVQMRKREGTIASYLARLCAKNSIAGPMGPTFGGVFSQSSEQALTFQWKHGATTTNGLEKREIFFAHWGVQCLADEIAKNKELRLRLPLRLHPAVRLSDRQIISCVTIDGSTFLPKATSMDVSKIVQMVLSNIDGESTAVNLVEKHIKPLKDRKEALEELSILISNRFLLDSLDIPPGEVFPLKYLLGLLSKISPEHSAARDWIDILNRLEQLRSECESSKWEERIAIFKAIETLFQEVTGQSSRHNMGRYYADRFLIYEDCARACDPLVVGRELSREILDHYTFGLELLAPFWLFAILPSAIYLKQFSKELIREKAHLGEHEVAELLGGFFGRLLAMSNQPMSDDLKKDEDALYWLSGLSDLVKIREQILSEMDSSLSEVAISLNDPRVKKYRKRFRELIRQANLKLPVFASGPILQLAKSPSQDDIRIIFDSVIFGNCMHLTQIGQLATDREAQLKETELLLAAAYNAGGMSEAAKLLSFVLIDRQSSKFHPWIGPGLDLEILGPSFKKSDMSVSLRDLTITDSSSFPISVNRSEGEVPVFIHFPNRIRVSRKLIHERFEEHFPRIRFENCILQRENWKVSTSNIPPFKSDEPLLSYMETIRIKRSRKIPDLAFVDPSNPSDKNILIDFQNYFLIEVFLGLARDNEEFRISEMMPSPSELWLESPSGEGHFAAGLMPFLSYSENANSKIRE
jgi:hypothetical protein